MGRETEQDASALQNSVTHTFHIMHVEDATGPRQSKSLVAYARCLRGL